MLIAIAIAEKILGLYSFHSQLYAVSWCSHSYSQWYEQPSARENSEKEWNTSRIFLFSCSPFFFQKNFTPWYVHFFWQRFTSNHLWHFLPFFLKISLQEMLIAFGNDHLRNRENGLMGINSLFPHPYCHDQHHPGSVTGSKMSVEHSWSCGSCFRGDFYIFVFFSLVN